MLLLDTCGTRMTEQVRIWNNMRDCDSYIRLINLIIQMGSNKVSFTAQICASSKFLTMFVSPFFGVSKFKSKFWCITVTMFVCLWLVVTVGQNV